MPDVLNLLPHAVGQGSPQIDYAEVASPAPVHFSDVLYVVIPDWTRDFIFPITQWEASHGSVLPLEGDPCLIVRDPRANWRVVWWGSSATAFAATSIAGIVAGGALTGTYPNPTFTQVNGSAWTNATYQNSWGTVPACTPAQYLKDPLGFVHLRGRITGGASASAAFTLPANFRSGDTNGTFAAAGWNSATPGAAFVDFNSGAPGQVQIYYAAGFTDVGLGGITFLAEN